MKTQWNRVTWYSKALALVIFVALPFAGFWLGIQYGVVLQTVQSAPLTTAPPVAIDYYANSAAWQTDAQSDAGFSLAYPIDFDVNDIRSLAPVTDWRIGADDAQPGISAFTLSIPRALEPQTNFSDAKLTVGHSANKTAVAQCLTQDATGGPAVATSSATINGVAFTVFHSADAGAGNYYETTSYRTLHAGECWAVEYMVHSSQIGNYPPSYGLRPFDQAMVAGVLDRIVGTFKFL